MIAVCASPLINLAVIGLVLRLVTLNQKFESILCLDEECVWRVYGKI